MSDVRCFLFLFANKKKETIVINVERIAFNLGDFYRVTFGDGDIIYPTTFSSLSQLKKEINTLVFSYNLKTSYIFEPA